MSDTTQELGTTGLLRSVGVLDSAQHRQLLWGLVIGFALSDTVLTVVGLNIGLTESNPVARSALSTYGTLGLVMLKTASILLLVVIVRVLPGRFTSIALLGFCLPQAAATGINTVLILSQIHVGF